MNKDVAKKWVDALRSGEYRQARAVLRDGDSFCCLGVLCDLYRLEHGGEWKQYGAFMLPDGTSIRPSDVPNGGKVAKWIGFRHHVNASKYASLNDTGNSFSGIASVIERDAGLADPSVSPSVDLSVVTTENTK
jgi:hypothetical protein